MSVTVPIKSIDLRHGSAMLFMLSVGMIVRISLII